MIQRVQTLFLLELAFLSISLFFIPVQYINSDAQEIAVSFLPISAGGFTSTLGHSAAIAINFICLVIAFATIFLYRKRELQVKLSYTLMFLYLVLIGMLALCPFVNVDSSIATVSSNAFGYIILSVSLVSAFLAAKFVKKDIELLKSTDRIR